MQMENVPVMTKDSMVRAEVVPGGASSSLEEDGVTMDRHESGSGPFASRRWHPKTTTWLLLQGGKA